MPFINVSVRIDHASDKIITMTSSKYRKTTCVLNAFDECINSRLIVHTLGLPFVARLIQQFYIKLSVNSALKRKKLPNDENKIRTIVIGGVPTTMIETRRYSSKKLLIID